MSDLLVATSGTVVPACGCAHAGYEAWHVQGAYIQLQQGAKDIPIGARVKGPTIHESGADFAKRLLDEKYGPENYPRGPGSEYNKIKKWGDRSFRPR